MRSEFKNRVLLPVVLPLVVLVAMAAFIGAIALTLLYNTHEGALMLAAVAAGGILFTVSLASSQDRLGAVRRSVVTLAALLPILVGVGIGTGVIGNVDDEARNVNTEPLIVVPDDAPLIAAENSVEFCLPDNGGCDPVELWEVTPSAETEQVAFFFDNRESGVPHNVQIHTLDGDADDPGPGDLIVASEVVPGPVVDEFMSPDVAWDDLPERWYFFCVIHPAMNGVGEVVAEG